MFKTVGLVGVGAMGQALLHRLILAGVRVKAYDISEESLAAARKLGAETVESAAAASREVEAVHLFVRTDDEELDATTGPGGILKGALPGTVLILHSTVLPETSRRVADAATKVNVDVVDAPVTAVPRRVHAGEAVFLLGGEAEVAARVRPHLEALGERIYHFGPLGSGNVAKIAKNLATAIERVAAAEIVWLAEAGGLDPKAFFEMMQAEHTHPVFQRWDAAFTIENGHAIPRPASNLLNKDVGLAAEYARVRKVTARVTKGAADTAAEWVAQWEKDGRAR